MRRAGSDPVGESRAGDSEAGRFRRSQCSASPLAARLYGSAIRTFLYLHGTDLAAARNFYSDIVGLEEIHYSAEDGIAGWAVGDLQITVSTHVDAPTIDGWAKQLGWEGGSTPTPSWGIELEPAAFRGAVDRANSAAVEALWPEPRWVGYWSFPLRDPMGNTVELSTPHGWGHAQPVTP